MTRPVDSFVGPERRALEAERRALEHAARQRARAEAELVEAQLMRKHRARMDAMAESHAFELDIARMQEDRRSRRRTRWGVALLGAWLAAVGLAGMHASSQVTVSALETGMAAQVDVCSWPSSQATELARLEQRLAEPVLASVETPTASVEPNAVWVRTKPVAVSPPATSSPPLQGPQCDASSGDPCCAFGEIVC